MAAFPGTWRVRFLKLEKGVERVDGSGGITTSPSWSHNKIH